MNTKLGIIEGFYGIKYSDLVRAELMHTAKTQGYNFYIYAPKNESALRSHWMDEYQEDFRLRLKLAARTAHSLGLSFGFGLSPLNLSSNFADLEQIFCQKVSELISLCQPQLIGLFFDDVKVDSENHGQQQNRIIKRLLQLVPATVEKVLVCPTFYSFDPILEKIFGTCSDHYFTDFMQDLPANVGVFWTGNKVLSEDITAADLQKAAQVVGRKVSLWDNYPVNDGQKLCKKLFLKPFKGRTELDGLCEYHAVNPMNEGLLSTLPLSTLPLIYQGKSNKIILKHYERQAKKLFGRSLIKLSPVLARLNSQGLDSLTVRKRHQIIALCESGRFKGSSELRDFIEGVYAFDPSCLTS